MERISIFLSIIASILILVSGSCTRRCENTCFNDMAMYREEPAYCVLAALGVLNVIAVRLVFDADIPAADSAAKQWVSVIYFSFLGYVLLLSIMFVFLRLTSNLLNLKDVVVRTSGFFRRNRLSAERKGVLTSSCRGEGREDALCSEDSSVTKSQCACPEGQCRLSDDAPVPNDEHPGPTRRAFLKWTAATGVVVAAAAAGPWCR